MALVKSISGLNLVGQAEAGGAQVGEVEVEERAETDLERRKRWAARLRDLGLSDKSLNERGRPPSIIREACRRSFAERIPFLEDIIDGKWRRVTEVATASGKVVRVWIEASASDRIRAMEVLGKMGGVQSLALTDGEGNPLPERKLFDLSKLDDADLELMEVLLRKAAPGVTFTPSGEEVPPPTGSDDAATSPE